MTPRDLSNFSNADQSKRRLPRGPLDRAAPNPILLENRKRICNAILATYKKRTPTQVIKEP